MKEKAFDKTNNVGCTEGVWCGWEAATAWDESFFVI